MLNSNWKHSLALCFTLLVGVHGTATVLAQGQLEADEATSSTTAVPEPTVAPVAEAPINLTVSPITLLLETDPGTTTEGEIRVLNNSSEDEFLELSLAKFRAGVNGAQPEIEAFAQADEYQNWIQFSEEKFTVTPREWKSISITFSPPKDSALTYYYAIVVRRQSLLPEGEVTTVVSGAPAVLLLATVNSPNAKQELQLAEFQTAQKVYEFLPAEFTVRVKNSGNIHLAPLGNVFIDSGTKKDIALLSFNKGSGMVLPDSTRDFTVAWDDGFPAYRTSADGEESVRNADGTPIRELFWDFSKMNKLRFGKYTAHLLMVYDNGERDVPVESTLSFWVIPWRFLGLAVGILFFMGLGVAATVYVSVRSIRSRRQQVPPAQQS